MADKRKFFIAFHSKTCSIVMISVWSGWGKTVVKQRSVNLIKLLTQSFPSSSSLYSTEFLHGSVKHIEMSHTLIQNVDDETFQGLRLESLKLVNNKLLEFSEKSFRWVNEIFIFIRSLISIRSHEKGSSYMWPFRRRDNLNEALEASSHEIIKRFAAQQPLNSEIEHKFSLKFALTETI